MKKIIALLMALVMLVACFAGCSSEKKLIEDGKLIMGTNAAFAPYEYTDSEGNIIGIDVEIAEAVADKLGLELEIKDMDFDSLLTAVGGSVDIVLAGLTVTDERKEKVDFTNTYAKGVQVIIVKDGSDIKDANLEGKKIGVQAGTTGDMYCTDDFGQENVSQHKNGALAIEALKNGQVDCVVIDNEPAKVFVEQNKGLKILDTEYVVEDYAAAVRKGNKELLDEVNKAMEELTKDGTIDGILGKYIKAE